MVEAELGEVEMHKWLLGLTALVCAGSAQAAVFTVDPQGADHHFEFLVQPSPYLSGDYSINVVFDESAFASLTMFHQESTSFWHRVCGGEDGSCWTSDINLGSPGGYIDLNTSGEADPFGDSVISQLRWTPNDHGLTLNFYADSPCTPSGGRTANCHQVDWLRFIDFSGKLVSDQPLDVEVTYGVAAPRSVPEPATWAMMILGFGLVGAALRSRKSAAVI